MKEELRKRVFDVLTLVFVAALALGGYHIWNRIEAHNALDDQLIKVLEEQVRAQKLQLGQRCEAAGYQKPEEEEEPAQ